MPRILFYVIILFLATTVRVGNGEMPKVTVLDKFNVEHEGREVRTWAGYNILYDKNWKEIYRFGRY